MDRILSLEVSPGAITARVMGRHGRNLSHRREYLRGNMKWSRKEPWVDANIQGQVKENAPAKVTREAKEREGKPGVFGIMEAKRIEGDSNQ